MNREVIGSIMLLPTERNCINATVNLLPNGRYQEKSAPGFRILRNRVTRNLVRGNKQQDVAVTRKDRFDVGRISRKLFAMSRPINLVPSFLLSLAGSWMTGNYSARVLLMLPVWTTSACTALIAAASMLVNDCYDHRTGTDELNGRNSSLQSGELDTADVVLVAGCIYGVVMLSTCCLEQPGLRLLITLSVYVTFVYTPLLKKVMLLKNIAVAGVIASSMTAGGLAVAQSMTSIPPRTLAASLYLFLSILSREILMDVKDTAGDKAAGVRTIPVSFGEQAGRFAAAICAVAANMFLVQMVWIRSKSWHAPLVLSALNCGILANVITKLVVARRDDLESLISRDFLSLLAVGVATMTTR